MSSKDLTPDPQRLQSQLAEVRSDLESARQRVNELELQLQQEPLKVEIQQRDKPKEKVPAIVELIRDQFILIGFLILFVGIVSTHTYYAIFGIRYQFLDLPTFYLVYHGLIILIDAPYLLVPYAITLVWIALDSAGLLSISPRIVLFRTPLSYVLIVALLLLTYPLATIAGKKQAAADLSETTSTLPRIVNLELNGGQKYGLGDSYRLLLVDSSYAVIFKPLATGDVNTLPNIKRFSKGQINVIETIR